MKLLLGLFVVIAVIIGFIALIWAGGTIGLWLANLCLWLANLYGSKVDVYRNGYLNGFADGIKHAYSMRMEQEKKRCLGS